MEILVATHLQLTQMEMVEIQVQTQTLIQTQTEVIQMEIEDNHNRGFLTILRGPWAQGHGGLHDRTTDGEETGPSMWSLSARLPQRRSDRSPRASPTKKARVAPTATGGSHVGECPQASRADVDLPDTNHLFVNHFDADYLDYF